MSEKKEMATASQIAQFGLLVAQQVVKKMEQKQRQNPISKKEMDILLRPPYNKQIDEIADGIVGGVMDIKNTIPHVWQRQVEKLTKFWKEQFNHDIPWDKLTFPEEKEGFNVLEYIPNGFTEDEVFNKYAEIFGKNATWCYYHTQAKTIRESIQNQQARPDGPRLILHRGGQEPDSEHLNKSYNMFYQDGRNYMVPVEGIIAALRYRVETGKMMDVKGLTRFHALGRDGNCMDMCKNFDGQFRVDRSFRTSQDSDRGPREVSF